VPDTDAVHVQLALLHDGDPNVATSAGRLLWSLVRDEENSTADAARIVPHLIAAAMAGVAPRADLLHLAGAAGRDSRFVVDLRTDLLDPAPPDGLDRYASDGTTLSDTRAEARRAVLANRGRLTTLVGDPDPEVRACAAFTLAMSPDPAEADRLWNRLADETDPATRISLVFAAAQIDRGFGDPAARAEAAAAVWPDPSRPADVRYAAAVAWLCLTTAPPPDRLLDTLAETVTAAVDRAMRRVHWLEDVRRHGGTGAWTAALLGTDEPPTLEANTQPRADTHTDARAGDRPRAGAALRARAGLAARLVRSADPTTSAAGCRAAFAVASTWRSPTPDMLDLLVDRVEHGPPPVALEAARLLSRTGGAAAAFADRIAAAAGHPDAEVRGRLGIALAHLGDARAVGPVTELLAVDRYPWPHHDLDREYRVPRPKRMLNLLRASREDLLPAVTDHLRRTGCWGPFGADPLNSLAAWGPDAVCVLDTLILLLDRAPEEASPAVAVLEAMGPAAAPALPALDRLLSTVTQPWNRVLATRVRSRITGGPDAPRPEHGTSPLDGLSRAALRDLLTGDRRLPRWTSIDDEPIHTDERYREEIHRRLR
jgi:hypothetical protein